MIKNFFYSKVRKEIRRLNNEFKQDEKYRSKGSLLKTLLGIHLNQVIYFRLLKKLNTSVLGLTAFPISEIGTILMGKKKAGKTSTKNIKKIQKITSNKKTVTEIPKPILESDGLNLYWDKFKWDRPDEPAVQPISNEQQIIVPEAIIPEILPFEGSLFNKSQYIDKMSSSPPLCATQFSVLL